MRETYDYIPRHGYQDDINEDPDAEDPFAYEDTDGPVYGFGVPSEELRYELDKLDELDVDEDLIHENETDRYEGREDPGEDEYENRAA